jgi:hypothetical protein
MHLLVVVYNTKATLKRNRQQRIVMLFVIVCSVGATQRGIDDDKHLFCLSSFTTSRQNQRKMMMNSVVAHCCLLY